MPPSLALAQAVEETGWGTSRFVREGNALFGQYTYKSVTGMVPERRDADRRHRVRSHDNLLAAVRAYVHNLNSHWAYEDFRDRRAQLRRAGRPIDGYDLAGELVQYSERRAAYVQAIRQIIRQNRLDDFDGAWLNDRQWTALVGLPSGAAYLARRGTRRHRTRSTAPRTEAQTSASARPRRGRCN